MHHEVVDFVAELIANPRQQLMYRTQPTQVMQEFGLSATTQTALRSANPAHVVHLFRNPDMQPCDVFFDPGPDPIIDPDTPQPASRH